MQSVIMTSQKQTSLFTEEQLKSSPGGFPASRTQQQGSDLEKKMNATCGRKCLEQYEKFNHVGSWAKTFSALLIGMEGWYSRRCKLTWKLKGTKSNRMYFQLRPLALPTEEIGFGLWPTPRASMSDKGMVLERVKTGNHRHNLEDWIGHKLLIQNVTGIKLKASSVMEMMGFPPDWTELPFLNGEMNQSKQEATQ